jgi:hypothetical protein
LFTLRMLWLKIFLIFMWSFLRFNVFVLSFFFFLKCNELWIYTVLIILIIVFVFDSIVWWW